MKLDRLIIIINVFFIYTPLTWSKVGHKVYSPDSSISVEFILESKGAPGYAIYYSDSLILKKSKLGVIRTDEDFSTNLVLDSVSEIEHITDNYVMLHGKRRSCTYQANKRVFHLSGANKNPMDIIFQVSNDGIGFRYFFPGQTDTLVKISSEVSSFHFYTSTKAFLHHCPDSKTGWNQTQPSYEEHYKKNIDVGTPAPHKAGWVMPALFNYGKYWIALTETAVDTNYCGSRLSQLSPDGEYTIQFPQSTEGKTGEAVLPESVLPWYTPWRIIAIADNMTTLMESTLGTDLAIPAKYDVSSWMQPGVSSWSWVIEKDGATVYNTQLKYIDFAASMNWEYCLIDNLWDTQIGYDKIKQLADSAKLKNVKISLWYNSAGDWNTVRFTPYNKLVTSESRIAEFQKLHEMGISGIKVDFFGGDGQSMIKYYIDILKDAAHFNLAVNFHGSTFPRGWHRTYPNLVSMEAVKGEEYVTFSQYDADQQPSHCATLPYTRNLFDPMDFTPVNFSGIPGKTRKTTGGFEIALSVIFTSGIQHIAETPAGMASQKDFVKEYMSALPEYWEDVKFIDGFPGKFVVMARKKDNRWYIAGINGENKNHPISLQLPFLNDTARGVIITDSVDNEYLIKRSVDFSKPVEIRMYPYGGFVIKTILSEIEINNLLEYKIEEVVN
jgi:alpha-glucosidase